MVGGDPAGQIHDLPGLKDQGMNAADIRAEAWVCKFCEQPMTPKLGVTRVWHFGHKQGGSVCPVHTESDPESQLHLMLKRASGAALRTHFGTQCLSLEYEVRLPEARRIADALIVLQDGSQVAVEAQVSKISLAELQERTHAYLSAEVEVIWVFLEERLAVPGLWQELRGWLLEQGCLVLSAASVIEEKTLRLK